MPHDILKLFTILRDDISAEIREGQYAYMPICTLHMNLGLLLRTFWTAENVMKIWMDYSSKVIGEIARTIVCFHHVWTSGTNQFFTVRQIIGKTYNYNYTTLSCIAFRRACSELIRVINQLVILSKFFKSPYKILWIMWKLQHLQGSKRLSLI